MVFDEDADAFALTIKELKTIEFLDLSGNKRLQLVRDLFLILARTSLRFSDLRNLSFEDIHDDEGYIYIRSQKTHGAQTIPITKQLERALDKFPGYDFPKITNQEMNRCLKEIGKLAGMTAMFKIVRTSLGKRVATVKPRYAFLTTHTGRRTNITHNIIKKVPQEFIKQQSGHTSDKHFGKYVKLVPQDVISAMKDAWDDE